LITTILAVADYRNTPDKTIVSFDERPTGQPEALKAWFYPKSMLPSACEFAQDELLRQTADDMQTQVYPKSLEYMPGSTI
jgi:hypothetical protein